MMDLTQSLIIGVDGGGSGCRVAIGTLSDGIFAYAHGGSANVATDFDLSIHHICTAIDTAAAEHDLSRQQLAEATIHLGLAGVMSDKDAQRVAAAMPYPRVTVTDDRPTALQGALGTRDGFLISIGTGTIAAGRTNGTFRTLGGWGFQLGDQASAAWLGRESLVQVLLCQDGIVQHSDFTRAMLARFGDDPNEIVAFSLSAKPRDYGAFAPDIVRHAAHGDAVARQLMQTGGAHVMRSLQALGFTAGDTLCLSGGVGPHYAAYLPRAALGGLVEKQGSTLDGAFGLARARFACRTKGITANLREPAKTKGPS